MCTIKLRGWQFPRVIVVALVLGSSCLAAPPSPVRGVTANQILIGSCSALEGPAGFLGKNMVLGATAYFHWINDQGGVHGRKVQLLAFDDGYEPANAPNCFNRLLKEGVFAAGFFVGTPTAAVYVPLAEEHRLPVVGLFTGAHILYEPLKHYVINVRASYYDETRSLVRGVWEGLDERRIAVIYQDDAFGQTVLEGVRLAMAKYHATPVALGVFPRNTLAVEDAMRKVRAANPQVVMLVGTYAPLAEIVKRARAADWNPLFMTVSFVGTEAFVKEAGAAANGTIITQVVPPVDRIDFPTIKLYREVLERYYPGFTPSFVSLEGFVDAMVVVQGLQRAGNDPTDEKYIEAIESIHNEQLGLGPGMSLTFGPHRHKGFEEVYDTVIRDGTPVVFTDWKNLKIGNSVSASLPKP
jgi:branched-chain amino acid transport system substrate-binding protein